MAIYPGAKKRLIPKWNKFTITRHRRMNLHVAVSNADSLYNMFSNSNAACSHFYVAKDGTVEQYIDTKYRSASDMNGNDSTISVETAGGVTNPDGEKWTDAQVDALVKLWAWARDEHGIKNQVAKNTQTNDNSAGLSWHRLGVIGNFKGRGGILETSYLTGGILYSKAKGKICPGDAKILQIPGIWERANGKQAQKPSETKPVPAKVKPTASKPTTTAKKWPEVKLASTAKHTAKSHAAWVELLAAVKVGGKHPYRDKDLTKNFQRWLQDLGYYPKDYLIDGDFGEATVKALQTFLADRGFLDTKKWLIDGKRGEATVKAEIAYLNSNEQRGIK